MSLSLPTPKKKIYLWAFLTLASVLSALAYRYAFGLRQVDVFRVVKVGDKVPWLGGSSYVSDKPMGPGEVQGRFRVHFLNDQLPATCLDLECGDDARHVVEKGGHLLGFADGKAAYAFGIKIKLKPYRFDASVMAVTDDKANIIAIYENAQLGDLEYIVKALRL